MKQKGLFLLKLGLSLGLLGYLLATADYGTMREVFSQARSDYYALAFLIGILAVLLSAYKWKVLLSAGHMNRPLSELFCLYLVGIFFNNFLPTSVGGDAMRIYLLSKRHGQKMLVFSSVLAERATGLLALILLLLIGLFVSGSLFTDAVKLYIGVALTSTTLFLVFIFVKCRQATLTKIVPVAVVETFCSLHSFLLEGLSGSSMVLKMIWTSLLFQVLNIIIYIAIFWSLSIEVPVVDSLLIIPLVTLLTMLPISINGFGLREYTLVYFLSHYGYGKAHVIPISVLFYGIILLLSISGGFILLFMKSGEKNAAES